MNNVNLPRFEYSVKCQALDLDPLEMIKNLGPPDKNEI